MTNQLQGEILFKSIDNTAGKFVYTPWIPVLGEKATFGIEILQITASTTITWGVETRKRQDPTTSLVVENQSETTTGAKLVDADELDGSIQELVRYRIGTGATSDVSKWAVVRVLQAVVADDARPVKGGICLESQRNAKTPTAVRKI